MGRERAQEVAAQRGEALLGAHVVLRGALELDREVVVAAGAAALDVVAVGLAADLAQEAQEPLPEPRRLELVAQDRRQRERERRAAEHVQQRQVGGRHRLPQPLLTERPGAEALDVGHVRVQDERELAAVAPATHGRRTARKSSAFSSGPVRSSKSRAPIAGVNQP